MNLKPPQNAQPLSQTPPRARRSPVRQAQGQGTNLVSLKIQETISTYEEMLAAANSPEEKEIIRVTLDTMRRQLTQIETGEYLQIHKQEQAKKLMKKPPSVPVLTAVQKKARR